MARFRCFQCPPHDDLPAVLREFEADRPLCPRCGGSGLAVLKLVDVHLVYADEAGPIRGKFGRYRVACEPNRPVLSRHQHDEYAATGEPRAVTCRRCLRTPQWEELVKLSPYVDEIRDLRRAMEADYPDMVASKAVVDLGAKK